MRTRKAVTRIEALRAAPAVRHVRLVGLALLVLSLMLWWALTGSPAARSEETRQATESAVFAGGCFWCTEADFEKVPGVVEAVSGYIGGERKNPTYQQVSAGETGHTEAVEVKFDPDQVSYQELVEHFWKTIDPTVADRQFCDVGSQYRSGIFYRGEEQREVAERSLERLERSKPFAANIVTEITPASDFYEAEEYHQDYAKRNPIRYNFYRKGCGRDRRLEQLWGEE